MGVEPRVWLLFVPDTDDDEPHVHDTPSHTAPGVAMDVEARVRRLFVLERRRGSRDAAV